MVRQRPQEEKRARKRQCCRPDQNRARFSLAAYDSTPTRHCSTTGGQPPRAATRALSLRAPCWTPTHYTASHASNAMLAYRPPVTPPCHTPAPPPPPPRPAHRLTLLRGTDPRLLRVSMPRRQIGASTCSLCLPPSLLLASPSRSQPRCPLILLYPRRLSLLRNAGAAHALCLLHSVAPWAAPPSQWPPPPPS